MGCGWTRVVGRRSLSFFLCLVDSTYSVRFKQVMHPRHLCKGRASMVPQTERMRRGGGCCCFRAAPSLVGYRLDTVATPLHTSPRLKRALLGSKIGLKDTSCAKRQAGGERTAREAMDFLLLFTFCSGLLSFGFCVVWIVCCATWDDLSHLPAVPAVPAVPARAPLKPARPVYVAKGPDGRVCLAVPV